MSAHLQISGRLLVRNSLLNLIGQGLPLVVAVLTMPMVVQGLGTERFGILALAWVVLGSFSLFDLGLGPAVTKFVAEALGKDQEGRVADIAWSAVIVQFGLGVIGTLVLIGMTPVLVERILNIPEDLTKEARASFSLLALSLPVVLVANSFRGVLEAAQRFDLVNAVRAPSSAAIFFLPFLGVILGWDLPSILALLVASRGLALGAFYWQSTRVFPSLRGVHGLHREELRTLVGFGGWVTLSSIVRPFLLYLDRLLIGVLLTMSAVAYYTAPFEVITRLGIIPASMAMTLFPTFSALGVRQVADLQRLYIRSIKYLLLATGPIVLILMAFAGDFLGLWLGADFAEQSTFAFQILLLGALFGLMAPVSGGLLAGLGRPDIVPKLHLFYLPLNIGVVWLLVRHGGIGGAALSFALRACVDTTLLLIISSRLIGLPYSSLSENRLWRGVGVLAALGGVLWLASLIRPLLPQLIFLGVAMLFFIMISWRIVLDEMERDVVLSALVRRAIPREAARSVGDVED